MVIVPLILDQYFNIIVKMYTCVMLPTTYGHVLTFCQELCG